MEGILLKCIKEQKKNFRRCIKCLLLVLILVSNSFLYAGAKIILAPPLKGGSIGSDQRFCVSGDPVVFTQSTAASGGTGGYTYQWESSTTSSTMGFTNITAANASTYDAPTISQTTYYRRKVTDGATSTAYSNTLTVTIYTTLSPGTIGNNQTICSGSSASGLIELTAASGGDNSTTYTYQWQSSVDNSNWVNLSGATLITYAPGVLTSDTYFRRNVTSGICGTVSSSPVLITVIAPINNNSISAAQTICSGSIPASLTGSTPIGGTGSYTYQWESSTTSSTSGFANITGATNVNFSPGALTMTTWYRRTVTSGICNNSSSVIEITVNPVISGNLIGSPQTLCGGASPSALVGTTPTGGNGAYSYQWESSTSSFSSGFSNISGATSKDYNPSSLLQTTWYRRIASSGGCNSNSSSIEITVTSSATPVTVSITTPSTTICSGNAATFTASGSPTGASVSGSVLAKEAFDYSSSTALHGHNGGQGWGGGWEVQNNDVSIPGFNIASSNPLKYSTLLTSNNYAVGGDAYQTVGRLFNVTNTGPFSSYLTNGLIGANGTTLWVSTLLRKDFNSDEELSYYLHNSNIVVNPYQASNSLGIGYFGASSNLNGVRYWSIKINGTVFRSNIPFNVGTSTFIVLKISFGATTTLDLFINPTSIGGSAPATSDFSTSTTSSLAFGALAFYGGDGTDRGSMDEFRVADSYAAISPSDGYQWKVNGVNISGANSTTYTTSTLSHGDQVTCVYSYNGTCTSGSPATSNAISMTVKNVPILSQISKTSLITNYKLNGNANDLSGNGNHGTLQNSPISTTDRYGNSNSAYDFNGTNQFISTTTSFTSSNTFSICSWFKTTTTTGGKLIGFGNSQTGSSNDYDRHIYMNNTGQLYYGLFNGSIQTINTTASYNDGNWHLVVATLSGSGMKLYVDGSLIASNASVISGQNFTGFWKIGYDNIANWPSTPSSYYFNGTLDDIFIYNRELSSSEITTLHNSPDGAGSNSRVCEGSTLELTATSVSGATYSWTGPNVFSSNLQNPSINSITASHAGTYTVTATLDGCASDPAYASVSLGLAVNNNTINSSQNICSGTSPSGFTGTVPTGGNGTYAYQWQSSITSSTAGFANITAATTQNYSPGSLSQTTWYRRNVSSGCNAISSALEVKVTSNGGWVGGTSSDWKTAANWCGGIPTATSDVTINTATYSPLIGSAGASVKNLNISTGTTLILGSGNALTVAGNFNNSGTFTNSGGTVTFNGSVSQSINGTTTFNNLIINNANGVTLNNSILVGGALTLTSGALVSNGKLVVDLSTGSIAGTGSGSISGNITLKKYYTSKYHYISSPLSISSPITASEINDNVTLNLVPRYNFYYYNESNPSSNNEDGWTPVTSLSTSLEASKGYALYFTSDATLDFIGSYNHGSTPSSVTLTNTASTDTTADGWHLVGNPFPSTLDWAASGWTKTDIEAGIYFWDPANNRYASYVNGIGANGGTKYIPSMQGFFIRVKSNKTGTLGMTNAVRSTVAASAWREEEDNNILSMKVTSGQYSDETIIRMVEGATYNFDSDFDAHKLKNSGNTPSFYTKIGKVDYSINTLPIITSEKIIPLKIGAGFSGQYTISATELGAFDANLSLILEDRLTRKFQDLRVNKSYNFTYAKEDTTQRFYLRIAPEVILSTTELSMEASVIINSQDNKIKIGFKNIQSDQASIYVYNLLGQEVYTNLNASINGGEYFIEKLQGNNKIFIVKVNVNNKIYTDKVNLN